MGLTYDDLKGFSPEAQNQITAQLLKQGKKPEKPSKYHAVKDERNGIKFDSKREARRYEELMLLLKAGEIKDLKLQAQITIQESYVAPDGQRVRAIRYVADFTYYRRTKPDSYGYTHWVYVVEDVKSRATKTDKYKMKKKLVKERCGIDIMEV